MLKQKTAIIYQDYKLFISGEINFFNVMSIYKKSLLYLKKNSPLYFDFSRLKSSNSAALALLIEWIKYGEQHKKIVYFENLSDDLMNIAVITGIDDLIVGHLVK